MKKTLAAPAVAAAALTLALTGCSGAPGSIGDLAAAIEDAGYSCSEPVAEGNSEDVDCGGVEAMYFEDPQAESASHSITDAMLGDYRQTRYLIRGKQWWIIGDESQVSKVADSMGEDYAPIGY